MAVYSYEPVAPGCQNLDSYSSVQGARVHDKSIVHRWEGRYQEHLWLKEGRHDKTWSLVSGRLLSISAPVTPPVTCHYVRRSCCHRDHTCITLSIFFHLKTRHPHLLWWLSTLRKRNTCMIPYWIVSCRVKSIMTCTVILMLDMSWNSPGVSLTTSSGKHCDITNIMDWCKLTLSIYRKHIWGNIS